jgi:hypothetical protein
MSEEQKSLLLKITQEIIRRFNNDMVDRWRPENYRIAEECDRNINSMEKEYNQKYGHLPDWPYIDDVVKTRDSLLNN